MLKNLISHLGPATQLRLKAVQQHLRAADPGFIDVKRLIAELSDEDLMRGADAYFSKMTLASEQCRKPFSNPSDCIYLTRHLGLLLEAADLFRGARVLDVGCGTGWLTVGLAQMGCDAIGVDISPAAIELAEGTLAAHGLPRTGKAEFKAYDGKTLPLPDASVDRVVCFDAFHHVRDQRAMLLEFARVLRNGGRAAFLEPGPNHSKTPMSQAEMANFKVIENDVSMPEVTRHALDAGLDKPQMLVQFQRPFAIGVDEFDAWAEGGIPPQRAEQLRNTLQTQLTNGQCFFIYKGEPARDSRKAEGLSAEIRLMSARRVATATGSGICLEVAVRNTGSREWIAAAVPGQVNLGVHVLSPAGDLLDNNFARLRLPAGPVAPGASTVYTGTIREPAQEAYRLRLDVVAELVAWFGDLGTSRPVQLGSDEL